jgi:type VI secretion system protein ImpA
MATMEAGTDVPRPDWNMVLSQSVQILAEQSKDLEIVCYLIESLVRLHGFQGLLEGLRLCRMLIENYWEQLHPMPDEDGLITRVSPLMGLNGEATHGTLVTPILNIPLTASSSLGEFGCASHDQGLSLERLSDSKLKGRRIDQGAVSLKTFMQAVSDTPTPFYVALEQQIRHCLEEFHLLTELLDSYCGSDAPHSSNIKNALDHCHHTVLTIAGDRIKQATSQVARVHAIASSTAYQIDSSEELKGFELDSRFKKSDFTGSDITMAVSEIASRDQALCVLELIATYFRQTEPHSPIPYALEQAVRWGRTPLPSLLAELIPDDSARQHYCRMIGLSKQSGSN